MNKLIKSEELAIDQLNELAGLDITYEELLFRAGLVLSAFVLNQGHHSLALAYGNLIFNPERQV